MLRSLFRRARADPEYLVPAVPEGQRVYAIGDIHGCDTQFAALLDLVHEDDAKRGHAETTIILLGDLIDRGPDSAAVVERAVRLRKNGRHVRLLSANHEEVFLRALNGDLAALKFFCRIGGEETIWSYGIAQHDYRTLDFVELSDALSGVMPAEHQRFLESAEDWIQIGDYIFVHAGIRPQVPMQQQQAKDLRWIREPFLSDPRPHGAMIVHGHTIAAEIDCHHNRIGIDTGAYAGGKLTAIGLEMEKRWFLQA